MLVLLKSVFLHLFLTNECRIVWRAEISSLFLPLTHFPLSSFPYSFFPASFEAEEEKEEKAKAVPQATVVTGVSSYSLKRETV